MTIRYLIIESDDLYSPDYDYVDYLLDIEYNNSPSILIDIPLSESELGEIAYYNTMGSHSGHPPETRNTPTGKIVY